MKKIKYYLSLWLDYVTTFIAILYVGIKKALTKEKNNQEIERKFLVVREKWHSITRLKHYKSYLITQGYLSKSEGAIVRIRTKNKKGYITIKGEGLISREEYEYEIPIADAEKLLEKCENKIIKIRYEYPSKKGLKWEVDEFLDKNYGLILAEIELPSEGTQFEKPDFIGIEVSKDPKFTNANLSMKPYSTWKTN